MPRPPAGRAYVCGPYKHRAKWRLIVYTGQRSSKRGGRGRSSYRRSFESKEDAQRWAREFNRQVVAAGRTVGDAVTDYLAAQQRKGNKSGSIATSGYRLKAILDYSMPLVDLNARRAQDLYDELVDAGGYAVDTHRGALVGAKAFGKFIVSRSWAQANPFAGVEPVGKKSRGKDQLRVDEARAFVSQCLNAWRTDRDRSAIAALLPLILSLRATEVSQLTARDIDDRGRLLWIGETDSKSDAGRRRALVPGILVEPLLELARLPATAEGGLFVLDDGTTPADRHWVSRAVRWHLKAAGVPAITTHGLRGLHATLATVEGVTGEAVARSMGHTSSSMTKAHYIDSGEAADAQAQRVADQLAGDVADVARDADIEGRHGDATRIRSQSGEPNDDE